MLSLILEWEWHSQWRQLNKQYCSDHKTELLVWRKCLCYYHAAGQKWSKGSSVLRATSFDFLVWQPPWGLWEASIKISRKNDKNSPRCLGHGWSQGESELWKSDFLHHGRVWQETQAVGGKSYLLSLSSRRSFKKNLSSSSSSSAAPTALTSPRQDKRLPPHSSLLFVGARAIQPTLVNALILISLYDFLFALTSVISSTSDMNCPRPFWILNRYTHSSSRTHWILGVHKSNY